MQVLGAPGRRQGEEVGQVALDPAQQTAEFDGRKLDHWAVALLGVEVEVEVDGQSDGVTDEFGSRGRVVAGDDRSAAAAVGDCVPGAPVLQPAAATGKGRDARGGVRDPQAAGREEALEGEQSVEENDPSGSAGRGGRSSPEWGSGSMSLHSAMRITAVPTSVELS